MLLLSRVVLRICLRREMWLTVSKAFEKSKAMATVRLGGLLSLKPLITWCVSGSKAVVVDRPVLKPCCEAARCRCGFIRSCMSLSRSFEAEHRREMGL